MTKIKIPTDKESIYAISLIQSAGTANLIFADEDMQFLNETNVALKVQCNHLKRSCIGNFAFVTEDDTVEFANLSDALEFCMLYDIELYININNLEVITKTLKEITKENNHND